MFCRRIRGFGVMVTLVGLLCIGMPSASAFTTLEKNSQGAEVIKVQEMLKDLGYKITKINGIFDNRTYRAVLAFQRDNKIKISGKVDDRTYEALKEKAPVKGSSKGLIAGSTSTPKGQKADIAGSKSIGVRGPESSPFFPRQEVGALLKTAQKYIGVPYQFGGNTPKAFDCSGYVQYVYGLHGSKLPRTADEQFKLGYNTTKQKLEAGDLVFFTTYEPGASHCGIYMGSGRFIHASSSKGVRIDSLSDSYWLQHFYGAKHIVK